MKYIKLFENFDEYELDGMSIMELLSLIKDEEKDNKKQKIMEYIYNNRKNDIIGKVVEVKLFGKHLLKICTNVSLKIYEKKWVWSPRPHMKAETPQLIFSFICNSELTNCDITDIRDLSELKTNEIVDLIKRYPKYFEGKKEYEDLLDAIKIGMI